MTSSSPEDGPSAEVPGASPDATDVPPTDPAPAPDPPARTAARAPAPRRHRAHRQASAERAAGYALIAATVVAIIWANIPGDTYSGIWMTELDVGIGGADASFTVRELINSGLMTVFFFTVGLDVRREISIGSLRTWQKAVIPTVAAIAGLALPAVIFVLFNLHSGHLYAWAAVISTDTAFLLAALALVGPRQHVRLRVFLLALSVVDDIGALTVIAIFYTVGFQLLPLLIAAAGLVLTYFAGRLPVMWRRPVYGVLWIVIWFAVLASGIEPTLAGVAIALVIPAAGPDRRRAEGVRDLAESFGREPTAQAARDLARTVRQTISINERLEASITPWVSFVILPAFALANAGMTITPEVITGAVASPLTWGIVAGLVVGKLVGVFGSTALLKALRIGDFGPGLNYRGLAGGAALCGIGFTISLYVIDMAMTDVAAQNEARFGILVAGVVATLLAAGLFRMPARAPAGRAA